MEIKKNRKFLDVDKISDSVETYYITDNLKRVKEVVNKE